MKKIMHFVASATTTAAFLMPLSAIADSVGPITFEPSPSVPPFVLGSIDGQNGWGGDNGTLVNGGAINPAFDQAVVPNTYGFGSFGSQSFRISDAVTSGGFGDWVFSQPLSDEAGETTASSSARSGGTRQTHYEVQFDLASASTTYQPGLHVSVSPDRGDGARMSYLRFEDHADGIHVFFDDYVDAAPLGTLANPSLGCGAEDDWRDLDIATLSRTTSHTVKLTIDFVDGPGNDIVKVYIDGVLKQTGTSWEDYFRWCTESGGGKVDDASSDVSRTVDSLIIQARGTATPADAGYGFLIDNLSLSSGPSVVPPTSATVHIFKYIDGVQATIANANGVSFPMFTSTYNAPFTLGPGGWTTGDSDYEASTSAMPIGSSYSANEDTSTALVGTACDGNHPYALDGYTVGDTLPLAQQAIKSTTTPSFTDLQGDKYIIVWNKTCEVTPPTLLKVHILKYLDGQVATAASANNYLFPMTATWNAANIGTGSGDYTLGTSWGGAADQYGADTSSMSAPADYSTAEITDDTSQVLPSDAECVAGKYRLLGYKTSETSFADAATAATTTEVAFTELSSDRYVLVYNETCPSTGSITITKESIGGNGTFNFTSDIPGHESFSITTSGNTGSQTFTGLTPGTYHVTEGNLPNGWTMTESECSSGVVVGAGNVPAVCTVTNTANRMLGEIRGKKFEDWDGDGSPFEAKWEVGLQGWTIYIDANNNGILDSGELSTVTDKHGNYRFPGLVAGTYRLREVPKPGWTQIYPAGGSWTVVLGAGKVAKKKDFGNFKLGSISGMKYNDANGNGRKDTGETGLAGWTINLKGPHGFTASAVTAADGSYSFTGLTAGTYTLSEVMQSGWRQTDHPGPVKVRSGTNAIKESFGNTQKPLVPPGWWHGHHGDNDSGHN